MRHVVVINLLGCICGTTVVTLQLLIFCVKAKRGIAVGALVDGKFFCHVVISFPLFHHTGKYEYDDDHRNRRKAQKNTDQIICLNISSVCFAIEVLFIHYGFFVPHCEQKLPWLTLPHVGHFHAVFAGFFVPHTLQKLPWLMEPHCGHVHL